MQNCRAARITLRPAITHRDADVESPRNLPTEVAAERIVIIDARKDRRSELGHQERAAGYLEEGAEPYTIRDRITADL
jgi:hypothetical protein